MFKIFEFVVFQIFEFVGMEGHHGLLSFCNEQLPQTRPGLYMHRKKSPFGDFRFYSPRQLHA